MKKTYYLLYLFIVFMACSKENKMSSELRKAEVHFSFSSDAAQVNIFELSSFRIWPKTTSSFSVFDLFRYDSIHWCVKGMDGKYDVLNQRDPNLSYRWSHSFVTPGVYTTYMYGYKNNNIIFSDSVNINVVNEKDFLSYNWNYRLADYEWGTVSYSNLLSDRSFQTVFQLHDQVPSINLFSTYPFFYEGVMDMKIRLVDLITEIYGEATYPENHPELFKKYQNLFHYNYPNSKPHMIWVTPKTTMVLLHNESEADYFVWSVYAEPTVR